MMMVAVARFLQTMQQFSSPTHMTLQARPSPQMEAPTTKIRSSAFSLGDLFGKRNHTRFFGYFLLVALLSGCASDLPKPGLPPLSPELHHQYYQVSIIDTGWHTGYVVRSRTFLRYLPQLDRWYGQTKYLLIGWGNRAYYMSENPGIIKTIDAIFPSRSVICIQGVDTGRLRQSLLPSVRVFPLRMTRRELSLLMHYIAHYIDRKNGWLNVWPCLFWPHTWFFRSSGTYDLFQTCNRWTVDGLHYAGLPVSGAGIFTAGQVRSQLKEHHLLLEK
ncbi:DUF2459 domain-containing protein [Acidithiobacillus sp.]|uniref:DUF2459 domain-containing protein n=1 Tax=Acidithiobacillus sp. TaxID=1872118 RepID=UPI0032AF343C